MFGNAASQNYFFTSYFVKRFFKTSKAVCCTNFGINTTIASTTTTNFEICSQLFMFLRKVIYKVIVLTTQCNSNKSSLITCHTTIHMGNIE